MQPQRGNFREVNVPRSWRPDWPGM